MNREHKYKAWDGTEFYSPIMQGGDIYRTFRDFDDGNTSNDDPLLQYTNLKDSTGKEIYESSINSKGGVCKYYPPCFKWYYGANEPTELIKESDTIVGNIYTTPELINKP